MSEAQKFRSRTADVELALAAVPRSNWPTSAPVSKALLTCPRAANITRRLMMRYGVNLAHAEDVIAETAFVVQTKMLAKLDAPTNIYSVIYSVAEKLSRNWAKSAAAGERNELHLVTGAADAEDGEEGDALERVIQSDSSTEQIVERARDLDAGQRGLADKLQQFGWPEAIPRARKTFGRPSMPKA